MRAVSEAQIEQAGELRSSRIEALRALAAVGVLVEHVFGRVHGYRESEIFDTYVHRLVFSTGLGVFLFFALSGYLLYWPFARRDFAGAGTVDLRRYAKNRALRILPLYVIVVIAVLLLQEGGGSGKQWLLFLTFSENFSHATVNRVVPPMWSLVVEVHFYLALPLLALLIARLSRGSRVRAAAAIGALALASLAVRLFTLHGSAVGDPLWRYSTAANFVFFTSGMVIALVRLTWGPTKPPWLRGPLGWGDTWLIVAFLIWMFIAWRYSLAELVVPASFLVVGACVLPLRSGPLLRLLQWPGLAIIGVASYSLYLWHVPILDWLARQAGHSSFSLLLALGGPLCVAVAVISYRVIEVPFLRMRDRWASSSAPQRRDDSASPDAPIHPAIDPPPAAGSPL